MLKVRIVPRISDNIETKLLTTLQDTLAISDHADFCVGYFNLRGWKYLDSYIKSWSGGEGNCKFFINPSTNGETHVTSA